jgi:hypothetical protein
MESAIQLNRINMCGVEIYNKRIAYIANKFLIIYDLSSSRNELKMMVCELAVYEIALGSVYAAYSYKGDGYQIRVFHRLSKCLMDIFPRENLPISALASSYGLLVSDTHDCTIKAWDLVTSCIIGNFLMHTDIILTLHFPILYDLLLQDRKILLLSYGP